MIRTRNCGLEIRRRVRSCGCPASCKFSPAAGLFPLSDGAFGRRQTTLLRLLFLSLKPTSGQLQLFGENVTRLHVRKRAGIRRRIGIVFQDFRLLDHLTTWQNVALPLRVLGKRELIIARTSPTSCNGSVSVTACTITPPCSRREQQRAAIARAVIGKPELLLADEPTGNVDPQMARRLLRLFIELNRLGTSVVIATHDHQLMRQTNAKRLELHEGHVRIV